MHLVGYLYDDYHYARSLEHVTKIVIQERELFSTDFCVGFGTEILRGGEWKLRAWCLRSSLENMPCMYKANAAERSVINIEF
jgi:hypothetical protein